MQGRLEVVCAGGGGVGGHLHERGVSWHEAVRTQGDDAGDGRNSRWYAGGHTGGGACNNLSVWHGSSEKITDG